MLARPRPLVLDLSHVPKWSAPTMQSEKLSEIPIVSTYKLHVGEAIGSGSFGTVYAAQLGNEKVALKKLRSNTKREEMIWGSFLSELRGTHFNHPNIVAIFGALMYQNIPCLVMEYAGYANLQEVIDSPDEELPLDRRTRITSGIVAGLHYIHEKRVMHLDVKPANLIMSGKDSCKIADFGCSLESEAKTGGGDLQPSTYLTGTHAYKAPELLLGQFPTVQADVYSLAICMWQMLLREEPYKGEDAQLVIFGIATDSIRPRLPQHVELNEMRYIEVFQSCWQGCPIKRPTTSSLQTIIDQNLN